MRFLLATAALVPSAATALAADPVGSCQIEGAHPGGGSHDTGSVRVEA